MGQWQTNLRHDDRDVPGGARLAEYFHLFVGVVYDSIARKIFTPIMPTVKTRKQQIRQLDMVIPEMEDECVSRKS